MCAICKYAGVCLVDSSASNVSRVPLNMPTEFFMSCAAEARNNDRSGWPSSCCISAFLIKFESVFLYLQPAAKILQLAVDFDLQLPSHFNRTYHTGRKIDYCRV